jgi:hypothetical protein
MPLVLAQGVLVAVGPVQAVPLLERRELQILVVVEVAVGVNILVGVVRVVRVAQASSSSNTLVVPQQALQSSQDRPHGLPRLA